MDGLGSTSSAAASRSLMMAPSIFAFDDSHYRSTYRYDIRCIDVGTLLACACYDRRLSPLHHTRMPTEDCRFYKKGSCTKGACCPFLHGGKLASTPECTFFIKGACNKGASCAFLHNPSHGPSSSVALSPVVPVHQKSVTSQYQLPDGRMADVCIDYISQKVITKSPIVVRAMFLIDASGSMAGSRMSDTMKYVRETVQDVLDGEDRVTVFTFQSEEKFNQVG